MKKNKILFYLVTALLTAWSCNTFDKCSQAQFDKEINNGNKDPKILVVELNHSLMISAFETAYLRTGCTGVGNGAAANGNTLNTTVELTVYTASSTPSGQIIPDPNPYFNKVYKNQPFVSTFNGTKNTTHDVSIPETGAFAIEYLITSDDCNQCCDGSGKEKCGFSSSPGQCKGGKPRIRLIKLFMADKRPAIEQNLTISSGDTWGTKSCVDCDTCPEKKCY